MLFSGDVVFARDAIGVLNMKGWELGSYRKNLPALSGFAIGALRPGRGVFTISDGPRQIDLAIESLRLLRTPRNIL
jgi:hypothetical protein